MNVILQVIGAWSLVPTRGYRYLVRHALHVALIVAWVSTLAREDSGVVFTNG